MGEAKQPSIAAAWARYLELVMPPEAPAQREECRMAFYAGAAALFGLINACMVDVGDEPSEGDLARMRHLHEEIQAFVDEC